uniref:Uncharacterized protein n=1 Tax=Romanomermis culicivorax TaxID=13658 RepID=A0A915IMG1_ROMCU
MVKGNCSDIGFKDISGQKNHQNGNFNKKQNDHDILLALYWLGNITEWLLSPMKNGRRPAFGMTFLQKLRAKFQRPMPGHYSWISQRRECRVSQHLGIRFDHGGAPKIMTINEEKRNESHTKNLLLPVVDDELEDGAADAFGSITLSRSEYIRLKSKSTTKH